MDAPAKTDPELDGLTWRALSLADVPALTRLLAAAEQVDDTGEHNGEDDVEEWLTSPGLDLERDTLGAVDPDGELLAGGLAFATQTDVRSEHRVDLDGVVHPAARRRGLGTRLLRWQQDRAAELHRQRHPELPGRAALVTVDHIAGKLALAEANGYRPVRWWNEMRRDVTT
ncbi:MAG TPA: GNAT family N-acetyltransferase, partial [Mycobacteriales bacterium]|nr:GNAT family N-acetyltransferase [Mycobacteriales bacterium]